MNLVSFFSGIVLIITIMLARSARAFSLVSSTRSVVPRWSLVAPRSSSSTGTGSSNDATIVSICKRKIEQALGTDQVQVTGAYDDPNGSHISVMVVSDKFAGKRAVQRQQMVYKALWEELKGPVHAVDSMICKTPEEV